LLLKTSVTLNRAFNCNKIFYHIYCLKWRAAWLNFQTNLFISSAIWVSDHWSIHLQNRNLPSSPLPATMPSASSVPSLTWYLRVLSCNRSIQVTDNFALQCHIYWQLNISIHKNTNWWLIVSKGPTKLCYYVLNIYKHFVIRSSSKWLLQKNLIFNRNRRHINHLISTPLFCHTVYCICVSYSRSF